MFFSAHSVRANSLGDGPTAIIRSLKIPDESSVPAATCIFHQNMGPIGLKCLNALTSILWSLTLFSFCPNLLISLIQKAALDIQVLNYDALTGLMTDHHIFKVMQNENQAPHGVN